MQVNSIKNASFGQVILSRTAMQKLGYTLHKKTILGKKEFLNSFYENWDKCCNTSLNDLVVTDNGKVFILNKRNGKRTERNNFEHVMDNILSAMQDIVQIEKM